MIKEKRIKIVRGTKTSRWTISRKNLDEIPRKKFSSFLALEIFFFGLEYLFPRNNFPRKSILEISFSSLLLLEKFWSSRCFFLPREKHSSSSWKPRPRILTGIIKILFYLLYSGIDLEWLVNCLQTFTLEKIEKTNFAIKRPRRLYFTIFDDESK